MPRQRPYVVTVAWPNGRQAMLGFRHRDRAERYATDVERRGGTARVSVAITGELLLKTGKRVPVMLAPVAGGGTSVPTAPPGPPPYTPNPVTDFAASWISTDGVVRLAGFIRFEGAQPGGSGDSWTSISATLTFSSADAPTYVVTTSSDQTGTIPVGARVKVTHAAATKYFIVSAIDAATMTLYGGTDYTLAATAITAPSFSMAKVPLGFNANPSKWTQQATDAVSRSQGAPVANTWYNPNGNSLSIPIGAWELSYAASIYADRAAAAGCSVSATLSTANNAESDTELTTHQEGAALTAIGLPAFARKQLAVAAKTAYFLNIQTQNGGLSTIRELNAVQPALIQAVCSYL